MYYKTKQNKTKQPKAGSNNTANSTSKVICTCKLVLRLFHCSFFGRWLSTVCMLRDRRFSEFYNFPADLIIQVREENVSIFFTSILWYLCLIRLCLHFLGWEISQRYWTGIRDSYSICSVFANCHCNWWSDWYPGALPSLGQRSLPPYSPRGELMPSLCPLSRNGQHFSPPRLSSLTVVGFVTFFVLDICSLWKLLIEKNR